MRFARLAAALVAACLVVAAPARAQTAVQIPQNVDTVFTVDPVSIASGQALALGPYDLARYTVGSCQIANANDSGATRVLTVSCMDSGSSSAAIMYSYPTVSVNTNAKGQWAIDPGASSATASTGTTVAPHPLCRYVSFAMPAVNGVVKFGCTFRSRGR